MLTSSRPDSGVLRPHSSLFRLERLYSVGGLNLGSLSVPAKACSAARAAAKLVAQSAEGGREGVVMTVVADVAVEAIDVGENKKDVDVAESVR